MEIYKNVAFYNQTQRQTRGSGCIRAASAEATRQQRPCWRHVCLLGEQTEGAGISVWVTAVSLGHKAVPPWPEAGICQGHVKRTVLPANTPLAPTVYRRCFRRATWGVGDTMTASNVGGSKDPRRAPDAKGAGADQREPLTQTCGQSRRASWRW